MKMTVRKTMNRVPVFKINMCMEKIFDKLKFTADTAELVGMSRNFGGGGIACPINVCTESSKDW